MVDLHTPVGFQLAAQVLVFFDREIFLVAPLAFFTLYFITWYHGPLAAVVDDLVPAAEASTAQAGFIATMHFFGTAPSSYVVGALSDQVGLRWALLAPLGAVAAAGLVIMGGWRHAPERAMTGR